jgi:acyl-CoA synthetase (AMP-forming)/AMP-acid ligase II
MLVRDLFKEQVLKAPDEVALVFKEKETTWREIDSLSNRFAHGMLGLGIKKGDRVAALLTNSLEFIVTYLAILKSGGIFVPLNFQLTASSIEYALNHSKSKILVCDDEFVPTIKKILPKLNAIHRVITVGEKESQDGMLSFREVLFRGKDSEFSIPLNDDDTSVFWHSIGPECSTWAQENRYCWCCLSFIPLQLTA